MTPTKDTGDSDDTLCFPYCDNVNKYDKIGKIGQGMTNTHTHISIVTLNIAIFYFVLGTFGEVFKARHSKTKKLVALKKVLMENEKEGFPITALREIKILQLLKHENVVNLIEICRTTSNTTNYRATFYLVFDFCEHDLAGLLSNITFPLGKAWVFFIKLFNMN